MMIDNMRRIWTIIVVLGLAGGSYLLFGLWDYARTIATQAQCANNLKEICLAMRLYAAEHDNQWPRNLQSIAGYKGMCKNPAVFVCPRTGHKPAALSQAEQWTDYTFATLANGMRTNDQGVAAYCLPKNHDGAFGLILFNGGRVSITPAKDFWMAVKTAETLSPSDFWKITQ